MKKYTILLTLVLFTLIIIFSCEDYVTSVDPLIDRVEDERLTSEGQVDFTINGVHTRFATTHDVLTVIACLLSDELFFDANVPNATFPTFNDIDIGEITLDNNSVDAPFDGLGELRFFADDFVRRIGDIGDFEETAKKSEALFYGYLYGGIARYLYATYFGLNENEGGGVIDEGEFIPSADMYALALAKLQLALQNTSDEYLTRLVNSIIARIYLYTDDYTNAATYAGNGLIDGDLPFQSKHSVESDNYFWQQAGIGRTQCVVDWRFLDYIEQDPAEEARIPLGTIMGNDDTLYYMQNKYPTEDSPINFISWQENGLMLAELDIRSGNNAGALVRINAVRASHGLSDLTTVDMNVLILEREKELFITGARLVDQRRFDSVYSTWHLGADKWHYFPITESERNINPNID